MDLKVLQAVMIGSTEWIIILVIGVLLFGASAIPKIAKSVGQAKKEFEKGLVGSSEETKNKDKKTPAVEDSNNNK